MSEDRRTTDADLSRRMDTQDTLLREIRDMIVGHVAEEKEQKRIDEPAAKALSEIVLLWRASKIIVPALVALAVAILSTLGWAKEHLK